MYWNNSAWKSLVFKKPGLTLTWDVLKYVVNCYAWFRYHWLTLTWDVLKYKYISYNELIYTGLTLTWDVLKCIQYVFARWFI